MAAEGEGNFISQIYKQNLMFAIPKYLTQV